MRRIATVLAATALASVAIGAGASAAYAADQPSLSVTPSPAMPGSTVVISVSGGCTASSASATSEAFTGKVELSTGSARIYTGTTTIRSAIKAGTYSIDVACPGGATSTYRFEVGTASKGARTGLGGSVGGMNTGRIAGGIALLGVAAGGVVMLRRRRADHN
ncbi:hypothetical protein G3I60_06405 [Streptomyces sp. SID13666]|uniref:hypothetical protein n=1 Tax=unclassified Streptomyces TaxID=2593676 RepID=UPI0013BF5BCF|nr:MULTISPECIES: hypothetical protein [unclassified Streptomyces]NEA53801.1 hypothetical protein [Streptomyces sp. SID13666]NEA71579.1 hypothetical protein [Streptomyces sp. SID13588]